MTATPNLALPLLAAAQAQKHVTHNEALVALDTLVQLGVLSRAATSPPPDPSEGDRYLLAGPNPTGAWAGWSGRIARFQDGGWISHVPKTGWLAFVADEADLYTYTGSGWASFRATIAQQNLPVLGIGTTADATNPFAAKLNRALWTAKTAAEGGTGDLRTTLSKEAPGKTLSLVFQTAYSGRAELGLTGDDNLHVKVSPDGAAWTEALRINGATGGVDFLASSTDLPSAATTDLGSVSTLKVEITGTAAITSFGGKPHAIRAIRFAGSLTLTHNAVSLVLPGGANIVTTAGDTALATSDAAGNWRVRAYQKADGTPVVLSTSLPTLSVAGQATAALGSAGGPAWSFSGDANTGIYSPGADQILLATGGADRLSVDGSGHLTPGADAVQQLGSPSRRWSAISATTLTLKSNGTAFVVLDKAASGNDTQVVAKMGGTNRWLVQFADTTAEAGANAGSNFAINRYSDAGAYLGTPLAIARASGTITAAGTVQPSPDNTQTLGTAALRWSTVYAGSGTINTSDAAEKQRRGEPGEGLLRAWGRVRAEVFQYRDSIARKGEDHARLHLGYVAQDVEAAFRAEGLDPGRYALWCSDPILAPVTKTRTVERARTETVEVEEPAIEMRGGVPVQVSLTRQEIRPVTERVQVVDESGAAIPGLFHEVVLTEAVEEVFEVMEPTGGVRLGLRYDQCLVLEAAYLRSLAAAVGV